MAEKHFTEQRQFAEKFLVPYLETHIPEFRKKRVLEVGCAEGGFLDYLYHSGMMCMGIELESNRVATAKKMNRELSVRQGDITDESLLQQINDRFDIVVMRDVIEHIPDKEKALGVVWHFLKPGGYLFSTFPPRFSPFAGHQQHARSFLRYTPYVSLFPEFFWYWLGRRLGESEKFLGSAMRNYRVGLSIGHFRQIYRKLGFRPVVQDHYLLRPVFKYRFGTPILKFPHIPILQEVLTTGCEYLLVKPE